MKVKDYLKTNEKKPKYNYYFVVNVISKHRNEEITIKHESDYKNKTPAIENYLNCKIDKIENYDIPVSEWNFTHETRNYTIKGDKIYINLNDFLSINKAWAKLIDRENKRKRFTL